jgi:hypothetical protein
VLHTDTLFGHSVQCAGQRRVTPSRRKVTNAQTVWHICLVCVFLAKQALPLET